LIPAFFEKEAVTKLPLLVSCIFRSAKKIFNRFLSGHAPDKKHLSGCQCASVSRKRVHAAACKSQSRGIAS
jgi:hypothetical protein